jgi:hypothetical protein
MRADERVAPTYDSHIDSHIRTVLSGIFGHGMRNPTLQLTWREEMQLSSSLPDVPDVARRVGSLYANGCSILVP